MTMKQQKEVGRAPKPEVRILTDPELPCWSFFSHAPIYVPNVTFSLEDQSPPEALCPDKALESRHRPELLPEP